jgi:cysteine dioxygenase
MKSLEELLLAVRKEFGDHGIEECDVNKLKEIMDSYSSNPDDWKKYAIFDTNKYTRNLVDDGNGKYNVIVLCWGPGQSSPIHNHPNSHCVFKVLQGQLTESRFQWPKESRKMELEQKTNYYLDQVNYMHDSIGLHKVQNDSQGPAMSLHIYSPPILECSTFVQETGQERASGKCLFHSKYGVLCDIAVGLCQKYHEPCNLLHQVKKELGCIIPAPNNSKTYKLISNSPVIDSERRHVPPKVIGPTEHGQILKPSSFK